MPNRIIKEGIRTSRRINALSDFQYRVWSYLLTYVDDYGRGSADPELLKGFLFPRRRRVTEADIAKALAEMADMGCILLYEAEGESYLCFPTWSDHQRIQQKRSKFPGPAPEDLSRWAAVTHREPPPESSRNPIPIPNESVSESGSGGPPQTGRAASAAAESAVLLLPLNDKSGYAVTQGQLDEWAVLYPAVDVPQELRKMKGWLDANPTRRKTRAGIRRFIAGWLSREQDQGLQPADPRTCGGRTRDGPAGGKLPRGVMVVEDSSLDLDEYEQALREFVPVYQSPGDNP